MACDTSVLSDDCCVSVYLEECYCSSVENVRDATRMTDSDGITMHASFVAECAWGTMFDEVTN